MARGIYAGFDIIEDPVILSPYSPPSGWLVFAPSALPRGQGCFEVTNIHHAPPPGAALGVFNFCNGDNGGKGSWVKFLALNTYEFRDQHVRTYVDPLFGETRKRYFINVYGDHPGAADSTADTWHALVYNWNTGYWEDIYPPYFGNHVVASPDGWIFHESSQLSGSFGCYSIRSTAASSVALQDSTGLWIAPGNFPSGLGYIHQGGAPWCWGSGKPWTMTYAITWGWISATPSHTP